MSKLLSMAVAALLAFQSLAFASPKKIPLVRAGDAGFRFDYESVDGQIHLNCQHTPLSNDSWDWRVVCGKGTPIERNFVAHLMIRKHTRPVEPKMAIEILYFVTDRKVPNEPRFTSHANWLNFREETDFHSAKFSQSVENDYAYLTVTFGR